MGLRLNYRLGLFAALAALSGSAAIGGMAYLAASQVIGSNLRSMALGASSQLAMRVGGELKLLADRARFYVTHSDRSGFEKDGELLAVSVLSVKSKGADWTSDTRWTLPENHPVYISAETLAAMDDRYPVDPVRISLGQSDVFFARTGSMGVVRIALPFGESGPGGFTRALLIDGKMGRLQALFGHREGVFTFMTSARGQLVIASDSGHFGFGEDLSRLAIVNEARDSLVAKGSVDYRETPQDQLQYAAFARVTSSHWSSTGLTVFAQSPQSVETVALQPLIVSLTAAALVFATLLGLCVGWFGLRWAWAEGLIDFEGARSLHTQSFAPATATANTAESTVEATAEDAATRNAA